MVRTPLAVYLDASKISSAAFARLLGVDQTAVMRWRKGERFPGLEKALAIAQATRGSVTVEAWSRWKAKQSVHGQKG